MTVYVEYIFLDNLAINAFLLYMTMFVQKKQVSLWNVLLCGAIGAIFAVLYPFIGYFNYIVKILLASVMVVFLKKFRTFKEYITTLFVFYIISFSLAGAVVMLSSFSAIDLTKYNGNIQLFPFCVATSAFIIVILIKYCTTEIYKRRNVVRHIYPVKIKIKDDKFLSINAFYDSGNQLYDPINNKPMVMISKNLYEQLGECEKGEVYIKTVNGIKPMVSTNIEFWIYYDDGKNKIYKVRAGVTEALNDNYDLILHTDMIGE